MEKEITVAQEEKQQNLAKQRQELLTRASILGFRAKFSTDNIDQSHWITLYKSDAPARMRYQFQESAEGLDQLGQFLQGHGNWSSQNQNRAGDSIAIDVNRENKRYVVGYLGLVGYDEVVFHVAEEIEAQALYTALLAVEQVEAD